MPASQGWAFHSGHNPKDFSTGSSGYVTLSSSLQLSKRACTGVHTEELGERRAGEGTAREGRGDGENITTGEVLLKKPPPIRRPLILLAPTVLPCGPLSHPYLGKRGRGEGREGSFHISAEKQRRSWLYNNAWQTQRQRLTTEEVLPPPFVLLLLEQPHVEAQPPSRHTAESQGSRDWLPFRTRLEPPQPSSVAPVLQLNPGQQGGGTPQWTNARTRNHKHKHSLHWCHHAQKR